MTTAVRDDLQFADLGKEMWSYLTGKGAAIDYSFVDMTVEVPRDTGPEAPRATWKLNGTLRITTRDRDNAGALAVLGAHAEQVAPPAGGDGAAVRVAGDGDADCGLAA